MNENIITLEYKEIQRAAKELGIALKEPKVNCRKCFGRGWIGYNTATNKPIPCSCILPKETDDREVGGFHYRARNRQERRLAMKQDLKKDKR